MDKPVLSGFAEPKPFAVGHARVDPADQPLEPLRARSCNSSAAGFKFGSEQCEAGAEPELRSSTPAICCAVIAGGQLSGQRVAVTGCGDWSRCTCAATRPSRVKGGGLTGSKAVELDNPFSCSWPGCPSVLVAWWKPFATPRWQALGEASPKLLGDQFRWTELR